MSRLSHKQKIVTLVHNTLPANLQYQGITNDQIAFKWFVTGRTGSGLRLTEEGFKKFGEAEIPFFDFKINLSKDLFKNPNIFAMYLNSTLQCPYYLGAVKESGKMNGYVRVYDSQIAMLITLQGSIEDFILYETEKNRCKSLINKQF